MHEGIVNDWLAGSKSLSPGEISSFASSLRHNNDLIETLFLIFDEHMKFHDLIEPISKQLFNYYRSKEFELRLFTLQFLPNLIYIYLNSVAKGDKKSYHSVETLLIGIYNLEVVDDAGQPAVITFRMPSLAQASIYHEPMSLAHVSLTETALRRLEECNTKLISWGPNPQVETLNAQNRLKTLTKLLFMYNRQISSFSKLSLKYLCKAASSLASQGFGDEITKPPSPKSEGSKVEKLPRIPVSFQFLLELLCGLYYAMYNDFDRLALQAVDDIYNRSCYECFANVLVVANAIKNSSQFPINGRGSEGAMGIGVALSPATTTVTTVNKFMITNASFRTKKLPDDLELETQFMGSHRSLEEATETSEIPAQKSGRKGKWKGWTWLHNSSSKNAAADFEEISSPKKKPSSTHTSPALRKKAYVRRHSADMQTRREDGDPSETGFPGGAESPKRRTSTFANCSPNRRSAGARLCMVFEEEAIVPSDAGNVEVADDIPIIQKEESGTGATEVQKPLTSIAEEKEEVAFSLRGSSLRSKEAVTKNLQKLGIGKKFKEKDSKLSSKSNLMNPAGNERKQPMTTNTTTTTTTTTSSLFQISGLKEKGGLKCEIVQQNGDFRSSDVNGHDSPCSGTTSRDSFPGEVADSLSLENLDIEPAGEPSQPVNDVIGMHTSSINAEEKCFTKVSSV